MCVCVCAWGGGGGGGSGENEALGEIRPRIVIAIEASMGTSMVTAGTMVV